jgi:hypothetical protein
MDEKPSPVEQLLGSVESALTARRATVLDRVRRVELALESYRRALEAQIAREFAHEHGFKLPPPAATAPERSAELLLAAVQALPELSDAKSEKPALVAGDLATSAPAAPVASSKAAPGYPHLLMRVVRGKIVVIGALSGRDRSGALPSELAEEVEWIDTERDGAHAVGNLPQRVRQGRVAAVVILDRVVQHKHTDPVLAAARDSNVPFAFAGQGGKASLLRAIEQIEAALAQGPSS